MSGRSRDAVHLLLSSTLFLGLLLLLGCGGGSASAHGGSTSPTLDPASYLMIESGTLPIVLSAPHGGTTELPGIPERAKGTTVLDTNTLELAQAIQLRLEARMGGKANLVAARVSRKYVDFNRAPSEAYESAAVAPLYQAYHSALRSAVEAARPSGKALLIDLHGQSQDVRVVFRGTRDGLTADLPLLCGSGGFLRELEIRGLTLNPSLATDPESADFNGGHIVATYGRGTPSGVNAVQLEFGFTLRATPDALTTTADKLATAIEAHLRQK